MLNLKNFPYFRSPCMRRVNIDISNSNNRENFIVVFKEEIMKILHDKSVIFNLVGDKLIVDYYWEDSNSTFIRKICNEIECGIEVPLSITLNKY